MTKTVSEAHPQLWHYTTAIGLQGILTSQHLWATDISYLNDAEEFTGFFDRRLPLILTESFRMATEEICKTTEGLNYIDSLGGPEEVASTNSKALSDALRLVTLNFQVYVTSFCRPTNRNPEDGLLSQWRGYGLDGGYAIVFDTKDLEKLLSKEEKAFSYSFIHWGDVDYHDDESSHEEALEWIAIIQETARKFILEPDSDKQKKIIEAFFRPVLSLTTRHKHGGFREESELRIVAIGPPVNAPKGSDNRPNKPISFAPSNGVLVPYISLFKGLDDRNCRLPIRKIIVGPHPEKIKRKSAVEKLLDQIGIEAEVIVSDIPYLGR